MTRPLRSWLPVLVVATTTALLASLSADGQAPPQQPSLRLRSGIDLVFVNVVVRDRNGAPVRGLTKEDFTITEDGGRQAIATFYFEDVAATERSAEPTAAVPEPVLQQVERPTAETVNEPIKTDLHGRRLIVLFFDLTAMQPEEVGRAAAAARDYVETRLSPADLVGIVSLRTDLEVDQDFTDDRETLLAAIGRLDGTLAEAFAEGATDTGAAFTPDDTEFNIFNTDRRLEALIALADTVAGIEQKKSVVYFSGGMTQTGSDNQVQLRRAIDRSVRANMSIYTMDTRGLEAFVPGGAASQGSMRGTGAFTGRATRDQVDRQFASQEALAALAEDTGGRAVFDSNDFAEVFDRVIDDTSAYYVLGYESTNPALDGRFRRITVRTSARDVKIEHRKGYYAGKDWAHSNRADREQQLQDQLLSDLSATDLPVYVATSYFRLDKDRFVVPVTVAVPGSQVPFALSGDQDRATVDLLGVVRDEMLRPVGRLRDTVKLALDQSQNVRRKNLLYQTSFDLPPGRYSVKVVLRENQDGAMGSFEAPIVVPDLSVETVKVSSVLLGTQIGSAGREAGRSLGRIGLDVVPNVAHVVSTTQPMYFYFETYQPERDPAGAVRALASLTFYRGAIRVYQTPIVEATGLTAEDRQAIAFRLEVPASSLEPGFYTCQVNVIDDVAGAFTFPRLALYVRR